MPVYNHYYPDAQNLINTPDSAWELVRYGPVVPVTVSLTARHVEILQGLKFSVPNPASGNALIDTGSTLCAVDESIVKSLGIPPTGSEAILTPGGPSQRPTYPASLSFPGTTLPNISFTNFIGSPLQASGIVAIIGRNVLKDFVFVYNGPGGFVSLAH